METKAALKALSALAQETRLAIYRYLVEAGPDGAFAGTVAEALGVPSTTLSFHFKELSNADLIEGQQQGTYIRYTAKLDTIQAVVGYLTETCCGGNPEMCTPVAVPLPIPAVKRKASRQQ
jgi:DNA-binding transcriptional ArsR family regulator